MVKVFEIQVTRGRKVQAKEYEPSHSEIILKGQLSEDEDYNDVGRKLLYDARKMVYEDLGIKLPARATRSVADTVKDAVEAARPALAKAAKETAKATKDFSGETFEEQIPDQEPAPEKTKKTATKKAAKKSAKKAAKPKNPTPVDDDIPDQPEIPTESDSDDQITTTDLNGLVTKLVQSRTITAGDMRGIIANYNVERIADLDEKQTVAVYELLVKRSEG